MKNILRVLRREMGNFTKNGAFIALSVGLPLLSVLYFTVLFKTGVPRDFPIAVMDSDNTPLSRQLTRMMDAAPTVKVSFEISDMGQGEDLMKRGKIDAVVVIPKDMEKLIYGVKQADVNMFITGANVMKNGLLERDLRMVLYTFSSGIQTQTLVKQGMSEKQAYDMMMPIYFEKHTLFNPYTSYMYYLLPIFLPMMLLIFILLSTVLTFTSEFRYSTAPEWLNAASGSIRAAVVGKALPYTLIFTLLTLFANIVMFGLMGVPMRGNIWMLVLLSLVFVLAYQSVGILIASLTGNLRLGLSVGGGYSVLAFTFSGYTFPLLAMTPLAKLLAHLFPMTYYMKVFVDQALRGAPAGFDIPNILYIAIFIFLPLPFLPRLKRMCRDKKYWGRL